jgi:toxin ParE1/3/4
MQLVYAQSADRDLNSIVDYFSIDNPALANRIWRVIVTAAERLAVRPDIGCAGHVPGTLEFRVYGLPYIIVYQVVADMVTVIAVVHGIRGLHHALAMRGGALLR